MNEHIVAEGFADAARRLRLSYRAQAWDDVILLPFMFLWKHAIEVQIKTNIRDLAKIRRSQGETGPQVDEASVKRRLQYGLGHDLAGLASEHAEHLVALAVQALPEAVLETVHGLAEMDNKSGTAFRYPGILGAPKANVDFTGLAQSLDDAYSLLSVVIDAVTDGQGV